MHNKKDKSEYIDLVCCQLIGVIDQQTKKNTTMQQVSTTMKRINVPASSVSTSLARSLVPPTPPAPRMGGVMRKQPFPHNVISTIPKSAENADLYLFLFWTLNHSTCIIYITVSSNIFL